MLRARQTLGLVLPAALIFSLGQDLARRGWPSTSEEPGFQMGMMAAMGAMVLVLAPAFVRLSWPTRPLPAGPLRDRLERLAARFGFRYTDILVWDTDGAIVNAGVTGALPWFRYVLLTDALIEGLDPHEVAAVFGHEVGHIRHRHLAFFGFFFVGSMGVLTLASDLVYGHVLKGLGGLAGLDLGDGRAGGGRPAAGPGVLRLDLRHPLAAVRAPGRRLRLPGGLVRPGRLPAASRPLLPAGRRRRRAARSARSGSGSSSTR